MAVSGHDTGATAPAKRLRRAERREQILAAATEAFARAGFAATGLDDVAAEAGITRVILYRHFESKNELYRAVLDRARERFAEAIGDGHRYSEAGLAGMVGWAERDPAGFRLLFQHAAREPEFRHEIDDLRAEMVAAAYRDLTRGSAREPLAVWTSHLAPALAVEAIMAWLDAGKPEPERAAERIGRALEGFFGALESD
ncbi:TetR/AcrR family transcriptional regulator [Amycolatopsis nigrescens]|uniref:TetR/AcrR family transcriptional regulator n=1 Tax=Amycolatopsis nigrescens TaxID=381445 RepID=UPI000361FEED|nr:TetR/AcrR family transcriptional regulator [Amycolatopsis nigrescens]